MDLAIAFSKGVTVLLGNGMGGFTAAPDSPLPAGQGPASVAAVDFNGDGKPGLAIGNNGSNNVTVLLNITPDANLNWQFTPAPGSPFATGNLPLSVAVGDFNGDGRPDLATANRQDNTVTVLLGTGTGAFTPAPTSPFPVGVGPQSVAVGDFNGDSKPDLAVANTDDNTVTVLLGDGTGGFTAAPGSPFPVGTYPESVAVGDFNRDGKLDLAIANAGSNNVTVLLGDGAGGFAAASGSPLPVGAFPLSVVVEDFNGDGTPDLAIANAASNDVTVLLGSGTGGFTAPPNSPFHVGDYPVSLTVGDFNGDGRPDLAIANTYTGNSVSVLLNIATGANLPDANLIWQNNATTQVTVNYFEYFGYFGGVTYAGWNWLNTTGVSGWHVAAVADFDNNGTADLIWQNNSTGLVTVNFYGGPGGATYQGWCWLNTNSNVGWNVVGAADLTAMGCPT